MRRTRVPSRATVILLCLAALSAALTVPALAQNERSFLEGKVRAGGQVVVPADETVPGHLYLTGGTIRVDGAVEGDLVATGGQIDVSGTIDGDVLVAGGDVTVSGDVAGSTRVAAGRMTLSGDTAEDAAFAAGQVAIAQEALVGQDVLFTAGQVRLAGTVDGNVLGGTGDYEETGAVAGATEVVIPEPDEPPTAGERLLDRVQRYLALLIIGALALWLAPRSTRGGAADLRHRPLASLGVGALAMLAALAAAVALIILAALLTALFSLLELGGLAGLSITSGLLASAIVSFVVVAVSAFVAPVLVGLWLGQYAIDMQRSWATAFAALALGTLAVVAVATIPVLGGVLVVVVAVLGLGALTLQAWRRGRVGQGPPPTEPAYPQS